MTDDEAILELLAANAEGAARKAKRAAARREKQEIKSLANRIEHERAQAEREDAEAEAAKRLGVSGA